MSAAIINVEIIVRRADRFLMIERSAHESHGAGWLCFPGGKLDPGTATMHALEVTAQRELLEEVSLSVALPDLVYIESHTFLIGDQTVLDVVFLADTTQGEPVAVDATEVAGLAWMTEDEILRDHRVQPFTRESLRLALRSGTTPT